MLKIINDIQPFFEDCYRRINVREYARIAGVTPPTASKMLSAYREEGLLCEEAYRNYMLFYANRESRDFLDLSRMYWRRKLSGLVSLVERSTSNPCIVLFGSLSKGEAKADSDVDIAVFGVRKEMEFSRFEKALGRKVQVFWDSSLGSMKNYELAKNIANGYVLFGRLEV